MSKTLLKEGMLTITACITIAIPLATMRKSAIFHTLPARPLAFYVCPFICKFYDPKKFSKTPNRNCTQNSSLCQIPHLS